MESVFAGNKSAAAELLPNLSVFCLPVAVSAVKTDSFGLNSHGWSDGFHVEYRLYGFNIRGNRDFAYWTDVGNNSKSEFRLLAIKVFIIIGVLYGFKYQLSCNYTGCQSIQWDADRYLSFISRER